MKETIDAIGDLTPLDLVLAGTHDTLTYDLGNYIAESEILQRMRQPEHRVMCIAYRCTKPSCSRLSVPTLQSVIVKPTSDNCIMQMQTQLMIQCEACRLFLKPLAPVPILGVSLINRQ